MLRSELIDILFREFTEVAASELDDVFEVDVQPVSNKRFGVGCNDVRCRRFRSDVALIECGVAGLPDDVPPSAVFEVVQSFFHELEHVNHYAAFRCEENIQDMEPPTDAFLYAYMARQENEGMYLIGYTDNPFELDANAKAVVRARDFCSDIMPDVDFDDIAVSVWKKRCESSNTRFVHGIDGCFTAEDIADDMDKAMYDAICHETAPDPCMPGDSVYEYLSSWATDDFACMWRDAESQADRAFLAAAVTHVMNPKMEAAVSPKGVPAPDFAYGMTYLKALREAQKGRAGSCSRDESEWCSFEDVGRLLQYSLEQGELSLESPKSERLNVECADKNGWWMEHRAAMWNGDRHEAVRYDEAEGLAIDTVVNSLFDGYLEVRSGKLPDVVATFMDKVASWRKLGCDYRDAMCKVFGFGDYEDLHALWISDEDDVSEELDACGLELFE